MGKDEAYLAVEGQELFLLFHDEVVGTFIYRRISLSVLPLPGLLLAALVCGKIAVMH